jgi:hypothetical protein
LVWVRIQRKAPEQGGLDVNWSDAIVSKALKKAQSEDIRSIGFEVREIFVLDENQRHISSWKFGSIAP